MTAPRGHWAAMARAPRGTRVSRLRSTRPAWPISIAAGCIWLGAIDVIDDNHRNKGLLEGDLRLYGS